jgi:hypothetical protein
MNSSTVVSAISLAPADDHQTGCGLGHLAHQVGGHEHGVPVGGEVFEHGAHPQHPFGVQAVDRFVQHHGLRVAQQRRCHPEALAHAEGEPADPFAGDLLQADDVDHLVHPPPADAVGLGQREEVVPGDRPVCTALASSSTPSSAIGAAADR